VPHHGDKSCFNKRCNGMSNSDFLYWLRRSTRPGRVTRWLEAAYFRFVLGEPAQFIVALQECRDELARTASQLTADDILALPHLGPIRVEQITSSCGCSVDTIQQHLYAIAIIREGLEKFERRSSQD
jgi:hypothetical protein